ALLRRLLKASYEIQESVLDHRAGPRELVEQAERAMLEVARDDRHQDFRAIEDVLHDELDKLHKLSREGTSLTGTPSGFGKGDELRKGRVAEKRWPKILEASNRLASAPLWIDDSSDVGLLEVRAKARRLHGQCDGGLGLIIVDYLQLMRTESRYDNRVTAIGE